MKNAKKETTLNQQKPDLRADKADGESAGSQRSLRRSPSTKCPGNRDMGIFRRLTHTATEP